MGQIQPPFQLARRQPEKAEARRTFSFSGIKEYLRMQLSRDS